MEERGGGGSFVAVRRISQSLDRSNTCHSSSGNATYTKIMKKAEQTILSINSVLYISVPKCVLDTSNLLGVWSEF